MKQKLRIVVADDDAVMRLYFQRILPRLGHEAVAIAASGRELVAQCRACRPDLVITDVLMPELDGIAASAQVFQEMPVPVITVSACDETALAERGESSHVFGALIKPVKQADLDPVIAATLSRFAQFQALRREAGDLGQALADRKLLEQAKAALMTRDRLDEEQAFRRLQEIASDQNDSLVAAARAALAAD